MNKFVVITLRLVRENKNEKSNYVMRGKVATLKFTVAKFTVDSESGHKFLVIRYRLQENSVADKNEHKFVCE